LREDWRAAIRPAKASMSCAAVGLSDAASAQHCGKHAAEQDNAQ
jgi:hypothetical protein